MSRGLFIGRFQPFHLGHLHLIKMASKQVDELIVGIGCAREKNTKENPFSAEERKEMVKLALKSSNIKNCSIYEIQDFKDDGKWVKNIENLVPEFDMVFMSNKNTDGEKWVERCFKNKYKIKKIRFLEGIDGIKIRRMMSKNQEWQILVPKEVVEYLKKTNGIGRMLGH